MRGRVSCLHCKHTIVWRNDVWKTLKDGGIICPSSPDHKHKIGPA